jgi:ADP-heptose:LPS heptosyltransferase
MVQSCRALIFLWLDGLVLTMGNYLSRIDCLVLVVRMDAIGDFVLWQPYGRQIYNYYKERDKKVVLLCEQSVAELAAISSVADQIIPISAGRYSRSFAYRVGIMLRLAGLRAAFAIQPTYSRVLSIGDSLVFATGARERVGCVGDLSNTSVRFKWLGYKLYTRLITIANELKTEIEKNRAITEQLLNHPVELELAKFDLNGISSPLSELVFSERESKPYVVLFPGASWIGKMWPVDRFAQIAVQLLNMGYLPVIAGGNSEKKLAMQILDLTNSAAVDMTGNTSLTQLMALIKYSELLVTNDTSAVHFAAALQKPAVCILGGGHFGRFLPYPESLKEKYPVQPVYAWEAMPCFGCNWQCKFHRRPQDPVKCIKDVSLSMVADVIRRQLVR